MKATLPPPSTTTPVPTTPHPSQLTYQASSDYHWPQFNKNVTKDGISGNWRPATGTDIGPFGFGKAIKFEDYQCLTDENWMKPDVENGFEETDPCMLNPMNCTEGFTWSVWEKMMFGPEVVTGSTKKQYIMSTGGDYNAAKGHAWPGFALYHQGMDLVAMVSTGTKVWEIRVAGQLYNNTWVEIGIRWITPDLSKPQLTETPEGREKMGGLEMYIGGILMCDDEGNCDGDPRMVGQSILYEQTERGSTSWIPQPPLLVEGHPVMMLGCHRNSLMYSKGMGYTGFAGTKDFPAQFDELVIWRKRLPPNEFVKLLGGFNADTSQMNPEQMKVSLNGVDTNDPAQAAAAQENVEIMLQGKKTTTPRFPTRTPLPETTTTLPAYMMESSTSMPTTTSNDPQAMDDWALRKNMIGQQEMIGMLLKTDGVTEGEDPKSVMQWLKNAKLAAALLAGTEDNRIQWEAVHKENKHIGAMKTVKEMEEYMLAWVSAVNTTADGGPNRPAYNFDNEYFDPENDTLKFATSSDDFVMNVYKIPWEALRQDDRGEKKVRYNFPDYNGAEWKDAKANWDDVKENYTVPTGMFKDVPGCMGKPITILTAVYNGLPALTAKRRNPVTIKSKDFFIDSKVISVRTKQSADPMSGDIENTYKCEADLDYMKENPVRLTFYHKKIQKAKRTLMWHGDDDYWSGLEVRHCVYWNEKFGHNGAWDDVLCKVLDDDDEKTECECGALGSYAVLSEMLSSPSSVDISFIVMIIKWIGIIVGTILLTIFIAVVFLSVVVGEMFHQIRMYTCMSYLIANIFFLLGDTSLCDDRHNNMTISMTMMFFYQAAIWWNMCEAHATFKGITSGLINGRTSVYHPISWGGPMWCLGALCLAFGNKLGTHPQCMISWENVVVAPFFYFNTLTFLLTFYFEFIIVLNVVRVQSHNKETVMYLKDQVKGLILTSVLMATLWSWKMIGWLSYYKDPTMDISNPAPLFHIYNGWFGVILFLTLGMWSKRFKIGLRAQADEKKKRMQDKMGGKQGEAYANEDENPLGSPEDGASPSTSSPTSPASSRPVSSQPSRPATSTSRPATAGPTGTSRPASASEPVEEVIDEEPSPANDDENPPEPEADPPVEEDEPAEV